MASRALVIASVALAVLLSGAAASSDGTTDPTVIDRILKLHNDARSQHSASPLKWDATLARSAQKWTDKCNFSHDSASLQSLGYGENLGLGYPTWQAVIDAWTAEGDSYNFSNGDFSESTGHFTQVVWRGTSKVGCASTSGCGGGTLYSCRYDPAGNYIGQFQQNVKA